MTTSQTSSGSGEITATGIAIVEEAAWSGEEEAEKEPETSAAEPVPHSFFEVNACLA